jgi:hypothetical protein
MACKAATLREAAGSLHEELSNYPWFVSVGMGTPDDEETLYIYVTSVKHDPLRELRFGYKGFPVLIEKTGHFRPAI